MEIKLQLMWINATLQQQKEINNSRELCFPFLTKTLNDLLNFSIYLLDDNNKKNCLKTMKKKIGIVNFKTDVFIQENNELKIYIENITQIYQQYQKQQQQDYFNWEREYFRQK